MNTEPKTTTELMSCEEKEFMTYDTEILPNGDTMRIPRMERTSVTPVSADSIFCAYDAAGCPWKPVLHGGKWYKQRAIL